MKIARLQTFVVGNPPPHFGGFNWIFLKLTTSDGIDGFGEVYGVALRPATTVKMIEDMAERFVIGADPFGVERLWKLLYAGGHYAQHPDTTRLAVISALEMACWDIVGKALGQPIYYLLGGRFHDRIRAYTYIYPAPDWQGPRRAAHTDSGLASERAAWYVEQGFTAVKFDPLPDMSPFDPVQLSLEALTNAEEVVRRVREAVGTKCDILIGTHSQMTTSSAIRLARRLEQFDPLWFEEPVPPENRDEMARVARSTTIPIACGERLSTRFEFAELLEKQAASILQMALGRVGGILEAKKIAAMAEVHYAHIAPHLWCGPIEAAANIQVGACSPSCLVQECIGKLDGFHAELLKEPLEWRNGYVIPPSKPGLGVELDEKVAARHPYIEQTLYE
jgi:galactonate dehydratase